MATIGLYDVDFNHGGTFNLSVPLMKVYERLVSSHQVVLMKPYEKTGRYNQIYYFKDSPQLPVPKGVVIDQEKSKFFGYGFLKESGLSDTTKGYAPSFAPYDINSDRIKNKSLYQSIKTNSLIDWREKDFTGFRKGSGITYVNDRDFLMESDWIDVFKEFDNNIKFVRPVKTNDLNTALEFSKLNTSKSTIVLPTDFYGEEYLSLTPYYGIEFHAKNKEDLFIYALAAKTLSDEPIRFYGTPTSTFESNLRSWAIASRRSFKDFMGANFNPSDYLNFKYRLLLRQDPTKITYKELKAEWLT